MACEITSGITITCEDLRRVGGLNKRLWLGNMTGLATPFNAAQSGYVTDIPLSVYASLYKFEGAKFAHNFNVTEQRTESGNVQWMHELIMKVYNTDPTDDAVLEALTVGEFFAVVQSGNNDFFILGAGNGLTSTAGVLTSGKNSGDDHASTITLTGSERGIYKRFLRTDVNTTLTYLNARTA